MIQEKGHILREAEKSWMSFFIKNVKISFLLFAAILVWGIMGAARVPKESAPEIDYGIAIISTFYDGASAVDIDSLITQEIENKVKNVSGIDKINSTSSNSYSRIQIVFEPDTNMVKAMSDVRSAVDEAQAKIPSEAENPTIQEIDSSKEASLFNIHLSGDFHPTLLRDYGEKVKTFLEQDFAIQAVNISGGAEKEIFVDVNPVKLTQYSLNVNDVSQAIRSSHIDTPVGDLDINGLNYNLRITGKHKDANDIKNVIIKINKTQNASSLLTVGDIATVYESNEKQTSFEFFRDIKQKESRISSVLLEVKKGKKQDIFITSPRVEAKVRKFVEQNFGQEVTLHFTRLDMIQTQKSYNNVYNSGGQSILIVFLILTLFLGIKEAFVASLIIPLSFLSTIAVTQSSGNSLNFMINFAMILSLGILVDTSIVIVEGIHDSIQAGYTPKEAAMISVQEFRAPLISGMLTTLAVFLPLLTLPGILGKYLSFIPLSVSITLSASLIIALLLIPGIASVLLTPRKLPHWIEKIQDFFYIYTHWHQSVLLPMVQRKYKQFMNRFMHIEKMRIRIVYSIIGLFFLSFFLPVQFELFPDEDIDFFQVNIEMPTGTTIENTLAELDTIEEIFLQHPEIDTIETSISKDRGSVWVNLLREQERKDRGLKTSMDLSEDIRQELKKLRNYKVNIREFKSGPPSEAPVSFKIIMGSADLMDSAQKAAKDLTVFLKDLPGTDNVEIDVTNLPGEMIVKINRAEALRLGVDASQIGPILRSAVHGAKAITISRGSRETEVTVRYTPEVMQDITNVKNIQIINKDGKRISLDQVVDIQFTSAIAEIKRSEQNIAIKVISQLTKDGNASEITAAMKEKIKSYELPYGIEIEDTGENAENADLFLALASGAIMSIIIIFTILVIQFNSYSHPIIIVFTIIMSMIGVNIGLFLTGTDRSLAFIIGAISLGGIVVNDAIILVDRINVLRKNFPERDLISTIIEAGSSRFQPIVLTTLTTAAGIFPLIFVSIFWSGLAVTIIFGLMFASTMTLIVTPAMYYQFENGIWKLLKPGVVTVGGVVGLLIIVNVVMGIIG